MELDNWANRGKYENLPTASYIMVQAELDCELAAWLELTMYSCVYISSIELALILFHFGSYFIPG